MLERGGRGPPQKRSTPLNTQETKLLLEASGETPAEEELCRFIVVVDEDGTGEIELAVFNRAFV